ncbi:MAG: hypothetical protein LBF83_11810 [Spirochaetaceae bacterium]|jgi:hypothetical protein|nr:hypothetical protein [Spirochaetaceae bacterium]
MEHCLPVLAGGIFIESVKERAAWRENQCKDLIWGFGVNDFFHFDNGYRRGAGGDLVGTLGDGKKANEMATGEAYAKNWERQAPAAMELTGLLGKYGGTEEENTRSIRRTFENAANAATEYGFSPEEGMAQVKQAAYQGLNERQALDAARDVFNFERGTGADRGVLSEFRNRTGRFGVADGLNTAWQGRQASGMAPGQFNEFLRAMQRTFEDGISKGFVRGADEIAGNLSFLADLGGSELWKGEQGANRLAGMNAGLAAATSLSSASDVLAFRGAQNLLKKWDSAGMTVDSEGRPVSVADKNWRTIGNLDHTKKKDGSDPLELRRGYDYVDPMAILERGLTPELFHAQMQMIESVEGNRAGRVEQMRNFYELNYTGAAALDQRYQDAKAEIREQGKSEGWSEQRIEEETEKKFSSPKWKETIESFKNNEEYKSTELKQLSVIMDIKKYITDAGQRHFDARMDTLQEALVTAFINAGPNTNDTAPGVHPGQELKEAYPEEKQPKEAPLPTPASKAQELKEQAEEIAKSDIPHANIIARYTMGGADMVRTATAKEAQAAEGRRLAGINRRTKDATKFLFSEGVFNLGNEAPQMNAINDTVKKALDSGIPEQYNAAKEFSEIKVDMAKMTKQESPMTMQTHLIRSPNFSEICLGC